MATVVRWSERYGCKELLVYTDNSLVDTWLVSRIIVHNAESLCPLVKQLLANPAHVTYEGEFKVDKLKITPPLPPELLPGIFISGASDAGLEAAKILGVTAVQYPKPPKDCEAEGSPDDIDFELHVIIIACDDNNQAWAVAEKRFPEDRRAQLTHQLAMKVSDSLYITLGYRTFILDVLRSQGELHHINVVFTQASQEQHVPGLAQVR